MLKNLNQGVAAQNGLPFIVRARPSANQRAKSLTIALLITALAVFAVGGFIGFLLYSQIGQAQTNVVNLQAQEGSSSQITKRYQTTLQDYNDTAAQLSFLEASVSQKEYVPTLLQQIQTLAQTTNLQVDSVKPGMLASLTQKPTAPIAAATPSSGSAPAPVAVAKPAAPPYDTQPIELTVSGTYRQIMSFIYALPHFPKILSLEGITLAPKSSGAPAPGGAVLEPMLTANLTINAYVFGPTVATSTVQPAQPGTIAAAHMAVDDITNQINAPKNQSAQPIGTVPVAIVPQSPTPSSAK